MTRRQVLELDMRFIEPQAHTWEVLPRELKSRSVVDQLAAEYEWCLREMRRRGLA
jgi:hypothetical protein